MSRSRMHWICKWTLPLLMILSAPVCSGFYLGGSYPTYATNANIDAKVNSLTSTKGTQLPLSYYSLPYCHPPEGNKGSLDDQLVWLDNQLTGLIRGERVDSSKYRIRIYIDETIYLCTTASLRDHEVKLLKQRIRDSYQVNIILDSLPALRYPKQNKVWSGFPIGYVRPGSDEDYIVNHLKFRVFVHEPAGSVKQFEVTGERGLDYILRFMVSMDIDF